MTDEESVIKSRNKIIFGNHLAVYIAGICRFGDDMPGNLNLMGLRKLLEMECLSLGGRSNASPSVGDFLEFLVKNSYYEGKLLGYVVESRPDVVIEGMYFVTRFNEQLPETLVKSFGERFCSATVFSATHDRLYCWWN